MKQYEYLCCQLNSIKIGEVTVLIERTEGKSDVKSIDELGSEGWELVTTTKTSRGFAEIAIFKRLKDN